MKYSVSISLALKYKISEIFNNKMNKFLQKSNRKH